MKARDWVCTGSQLITQFASGDFDCERGGLEIVFERCGFVGSIKTTIFTVHIEILKILCLKIQSVDNIPYQTINLTL